MPALRVDLLVRLPLLVGTVLPLIPYCNVLLDISQQLVARSVLFCCVIAALALSVSDPICLSWFCAFVRQPSCTACSSGFYQPDSNSTSCLAVQRGYYQDKQGQAEAIPCPLGQYSQA